jgi:hypothetical protein
MAVAVASPERWRPPALGALAVRRHATQVKANERPVYKTPALIDFYDMKIAGAMPILGRASCY